ncbi:hypothetical protein BS47DRAFT_1173615 [Hydnum rufescens UP504]|uniref:F-box domain-containing protein n=1 Tax=Hydnum rufescens UP504 TaxID=1448309 RepID=A0A9P6DUA3_9AGAM|nr:hypothetical protein BS47DRAFT_1173615 [Hydnum rufescens UP504]
MSLSFCNMDAQYAFPSIHRRAYLPPELWSLIFRHVSSLSRFFDCNWDADQGIVTPFIDDGRDKCIHESFTASLETLHAISLVCTDWREHSLKFMYRRIYIRRTSQLRSLVHTLERSRDGAKGGQGLTSVGLGWWVTHLKMQAMDERRGVNGPTYLDRLFACCPRLEVYLDARPYGYYERPKEILASFRPGPGTPSKHLRSLVWLYGGPLMDDFLSGQRILEDLRSLRCMTIHGRAVGGFSNSNTILKLPNLISIDLFISSQLHRHWLTIAEEWSMPNLTHLIIRTPTNSRGIIGPAATRCLHTFLEAHGSNITSLELAIHPGNESRNDTHVAEDAGFTILSIPSILSLLPNLRDLVLSARWSVDSPESGLWRHASLQRIGLRDSAPQATGFSAAGAHLPCVCSSCRHIGGLITMLENVLYGQRRRSHPHLSRRQCSINKVLNMFLDLGHHPITIESMYETPHCFPYLQSISLLDSDTILSDLNTMGAAYEQSEEQFWMARVVRCGIRNVQLFDQDGKVFRPEFNSLERQRQQTGLRGSNTAVSSDQSGLLALVLRLVYRVHSPPPV